MKVWKQYNLKDILINDFNILLILRFKVLFTNTKSQKNEILNKEIKTTMTHQLFCSNSHHLVCILLLCYNLINYTSLQTTNGVCEGRECDIKDKIDVGDNEQHGKAKYTGD